ncbi:DoxX family protein [Agrococcus sp. HG114]|uniref:DoxX family protein n=1 Tax=Agrococcus sp. HG114 TaxID=2969757 RepID=UPI00215A4CFD|nr:DoxX family protein [Agrococcus sp. HG114]MCR8670801.1 DoxX family protein [Agrococcus sp. HG114]
MSTTTSPVERAARVQLPTSPAIGLLVLRLALGAVLIAHGAQKIFFYGFAGTSASFAQMGVPLAELAAPVVAIVELIGGIAIALGILTRPAAVLVAVDMVAAALLVHAPFGMFIEDGGIELVLLLAGGALALAATGAGRFSLDALLASRR